MIARPFYDVVNNASDSSLTTYPGFLAGSISVQSTTYLQTAELNAFAGAWQTEKLRVRGIVGLRHLRLRESLAIGEASTVTDMGNPLFGQTVNVNDSFETTNNFFGGQVGASAEYRWRRWTGEMFGKVALGMLEERVSIDGSTSFMGAQTPGGLLALSSNIGSTTRNRFAAIPEAGFKLQAAINRHWNLHVGYSFLYVGDVVRPGSQVDLGVNPNLVPTSTTFGVGGPARPAFRPQESDYWAHLFTFGFTVQY
ncbi:MAG: BBP7 family outer membrane beta-barrel protein [Planctomycetota bacterium]